MIHLKVVSILFSKGREQAESDRGVSGRWHISRKKPLLFLEREIHREVPNAPGLV